MSEDEAQKCKSQLISELNRQGIYYTSDGRKLEDCRLYTVLWVYIDVKSEEGRLLS